MNNKEKTKEKLLGSMRKSKTVIREKTETKTTKPRTKASSTTAKSTTTKPRATKAAPKKSTATTQTATSAGSYQSRKRVWPD